MSTICNIINNNKIRITIGKLKIKDTKEIAIA
jgi:hypothetical protein